MSVCLRKAQGLPCLPLFMKVISARYLNYGAAIQTLLCGLRWINAASFQGQGCCSCQPHPIYCHVYQARLLRWHKRECHPIHQLREKNRGFDGTSRREYTWISCHWWWVYALYMRQWCRIKGVHSSRIPWREGDVQSTRMCWTSGSWQWQRGLRSTKAAHISCYRDHQLSSKRLIYLNRRQIFPLGKNFFRFFATAHLYADASTSVPQVNITFQLLHCYPSGTTQDISAHKHNIH